jgi:hypothetical protein
MTTTVVLLFIALASVGIGYGLWSKTLYIDGTVNTGKFDSGFVDPFTDDDDKVDGAMDPEDNNFCEEYMYGGSGSCDPAVSAGLERKDKDVGECKVTFWDAETIEVTIGNAYPSYFCTLYFGVKNTGDIPVKIQSLGIVGSDITAGYVKAHWTNIEVGDQIDPGQTVPGDLDLHVEQSAHENSEIKLTGKIQLVQWNEFASLSWTTCSAGSPPCYEAPEVSFDGNTVIMGELGEPQSGWQPSPQHTSVHGGAALLPDGSSYDVTFQYHVCSWDYLWFDAFSVSTSASPYWNLGLTTPIDSTNLPGLAWVFGGSSSALQCANGTETHTLPGYAGGTYLNAVLDTGTSPANHILPSYGTITIEKIVVNP